MNHIKSKLALAFPFIGEAGKNLKTETNGHTNNTANSNTIETEKLYDWLGEPVTIESDKKFYKAFYKQNILYKLEDFIYFKTSEKNDQIILQIVDLYEDKTGEKWFTGLAFLKISDFKSDIHTNPHELICSHSMHSFRLINIIGKCQVRNLDTIEDVEQYEEDSNNYYYKDIKELFSSLSIQRPKKKSRRYADTMPELLLESSNNNNNKPKNRTPKKILRKREKKESGDEVSSDEERSYLKSLRRRLALETAEKRAIAEQRERIEQEYLNNTFFRSRRTVEQEEQHPQWESMLNAIVLSPSRVPKELFDDPIPVTPLPEITNNTTQQQKSELPIPEFRILTEEEYKSVNPQIDELYWKRYEEAYITTSDSIVQQMNADYEPIKKQPAVREVRKSVKLAAKFFDLDTWCEDEILFFKELLYAYGSNFKKLSNFMSSKTPEQLEEFYKRSGFDITCNVCGSTTDDEKLLVCDSCDKAYHTYCLEPPLKSIPKQLWFCDPECENSYVVKCEACRSIENLENTAKCIICNRIYHFNCIGPDVTSVPIDWKCLPCIDDELLKPDETINYEDKPIPILPEVSPEDENELKTSKKTRTIALKIADSFVPTRLSYDDIKLWADRWDAQNYDFSMLKEDNLFFIKDNVSIFSNIEISDENSDYNTHLYGILSAVDICIDRTLKNPRPKPKVVQQDPLSFLKSPKKRTTPKKKEKVKKIVSPAKTPQRRKSIETPSKKKKRIVGVNFEANMNKKRKVDETDGFGDGPKVWIFQANKQIYDIEKSIKELPVMTWFVKQHIYKIKKDDKVYVWVTGKDGGVVAKGTIMSDPSEIREHIDMKKYYLDSKFYNTVALRSFLRIDSILDHKIDKSIFIKNSLLSKTTIIRQPIGTNFKLTKQESDEIEKLIKKHAKLLPVDHSNEFSQEISNEKSTPKKSRGKKNSVKTPKKSPRKKNFAPDTSPTDIEEEEEVIVTPEKKRRRRKSTPEIPQTTVTTITTNSSTSITSTVSIVSTVSTKEDFDENSENLENLNIEILDEDSKISENINKRPKRETRNSRKLKTNAENAENSTTNSEILNNSDISKDSEISNHSSSSPIRCEICLTTTTNSTEILLCSGCDQGFHVTCIPLPEKPIESWYCNKCIDLNSKCCKLCGSAENDDQMLLCDLCDEGHHMTCLDPPLTDVPDHTWFCPSCSINSRDKEFAKLVIGYKELRIECKKILFRKCEEAHYKHHKNMTRGKSVEIVRQKLRQLANGLSETRRKLLESAILTFRVWRSSIEQQKDEIDS